MASFLIQTTDNQIKHDFGFHLARAIEYQNWFNGRINYLAYLDNDIKRSACVPVGSLEFAYKYINYHYGHRNESIKSINIPEELLKPKYLKRKCKNRVPKENIRGPCFIKSATAYKKFTEVIIDNRTLSTVPQDEYFVSELIKIDSEWRCFIHRDKLVSINNYSGDFTLFPDVPLIKEMIEGYYNCPPAYTLDVGINESGTFIIEVHPFVSCGLYGFADYRILPQMFINGYNFLLETSQ